MGSAKAANEHLDKTNALLNDLSAKEIIKFEDDGSVSVRTAQAHNQEENHHL